MSVTSWLASPPADAAIQIAPDAVSAAVLASRGRDAVAAHALVPLPAGAVTASLVSQNIQARSVVVDAVRQAIAQLGTHPRRVALVLPDVVARVSLVPFDQVPARYEDLEQLIRWHVRKSAPFPVDDACLTFSEATRSATGATFVVVVARRDIVREYESVCEDAGLHAGLVDLATSSLLSLPSIAGNGAGDSLVVHVQPTYTTLVILRGGGVIFFRTKGNDGDDGLADLVHQTAMYYQDHLDGQGFAHVRLGGGGDLDAARRTFEERLGAAVEPIAPAHAAPTAPLVGLLTRTRAETVGR